MGNQRLCGNCAESGVRVRYTSNLDKWCRLGSGKGESEKHKEPVTCLDDVNRRMDAQLNYMKNPFLDLVQGQELPDATVLMTSRPHASEVIVTKCQDHLLLSGESYNCDSAAPSSIYSSGTRCIRPSYPIPTFLYPMIPLQVAKMYP